MKPVALLLVTVIFTVLKEGASVNSLVFPSESSTSYVEMVPLKPLSLKALTLCMRVATELQDKREIILFAYRTRRHDELNVWHETNGSLSFFLSGKGRVHFQVPQLGALQTHLCFTWDSSTGAANVFMDGKKSLTKIYMKGHTVQSGGRIILGQDPDNFLGGFDAKQSLVGEIYDVNMWDSVLLDSIIQNLFTGMRVPRGNVFDWETTELKVNGNVHVVAHEL